jgi:uncharacterized membrane protein
MATKTTKKREAAPTVVEEKAPPTAERIRQTRLLICLLCLVLSVIAAVPFFFLGRPQAEPGIEMLGMPTTHDMFLHYDQMKSFHAGLQAGEIYPRWEADTNLNFGAPTTCYYPPAIYYLTSSCYVLTRDWVKALLQTCVLIMIASAAAMYLYARRYMSRGPAVVAMSAYIFFPYHLIDQYQRGAIAELLGFAWMPLILLFVDRTMATFKPDLEGESGTHRSNGFPPGNIAGLAASYGLFMWSHPPTGYQFSLGLGIYVLILAVIKKEWKGTLLVGVSLALGFLTAAAYLLSAALEQNLIRHEYVEETWPYHMTYVFVHELYNRKFHLDFFNRIDMIWVFGTIAITVAALLLLSAKPRTLISALLRQRVVLWTVVGLVASFLMTRYSEPLGEKIPKIEIGVFTWRMLSITTLVVALLAGTCAQAAAAAIKQKLTLQRLAFGLVAAIIIVFAIGYDVGAVAAPMAVAPLFTPEEEHLNYAMIPRTAPEDLNELPDDLPQVELESDNGEVRVERWDPQYRVIKADLTEADNLLVSTFNFPGWTATIDGKKSQIETSEELGDMVIALDAGSHEVTLRFLNTPVRRTGTILTLSSFSLVVALSIISLVRRRKNVSPVDKGSSA